ncbi:MAG: hypothetical protein PVF27_01170 [Gemmatimonadales bacterium]|jgi:hypothetical protein
MCVRVLHALTAIATLAFLLPTEAAAQRRKGIRPLDERCCVVGIYGTAARPVGQFDTYVGWGGGLGLYWLTHLDRGRHVGVRVQGSLIVYGHEEYAVPFNSWVSRVWIDVNTSNMIANFGVGPQLSLRLGPFHPYAFGTAGLSYFATVTSLEGSSDIEPFASTTNFDDATFALTGGAGLRLGLGGRRHPVALDFSVERMVNGEAEYLREGGIQDNVDGSYTVFPIRSEANLITYRAGVTIGF